MRFSSTAWALSRIVFSFQFLVLSALVTTTEWLLLRTENYD